MKIATFEVVCMGKYSVKGFEIPDEVVENGKILKYLTDKVQSSEIEAEEGSIEWLDDVEIPISKVTVTDTVDDTYIKKFYL